MGDHTWFTFFSTVFHPKMSHDFNPFNVEDLHTVDNGNVSPEQAPTAAGQKAGARVLGFANAYGVPFAVHWALILAPVWLAAQPSAQITSALATATLLSHLELIDATLDARALQATFSIDPSAALARLQHGLSTTEVRQERATAGVTMKMDEVVPPQLAFFASGHQTTLVSLQWKPAFVLLPSLPPVHNPRYNSTNATHCARCAARPSMEHRTASGNA
jgi:hypothetical protein